MVKPTDLKYGNIYSLYNLNTGGVYIGHLKGVGRILSRDVVPQERQNFLNGIKGEPVVHTFNLEEATLWDGAIQSKKFGSPVMNAKERAFALEILNKKGL